jgi:hypothetical protein
VIRSFLQRAAPEPEYQGVNTRLAVRLVIAGVFLPLTFFAELGHGSIGQHIYTLLYPLTFCAFFEWWAVRRSGLTFSEEQLTLKYGPIYRFIPWSRINGVEWRAVGNFESLCIRVDENKRQAAPMIWRISGNHFTRLGSRNLRTRTGNEVDALTTIELEWKRSRKGRSANARKHLRGGR